LVNPFNKEHFNLVTKSKKWINERPIAYEADIERVQQIVESQIESAYHGK
jgi:hypothetical protein